MFKKNALTVIKVFLVMLFVGVFSQLVIGYNEYKDKSEKLEIDLGSTKKDYDKQIDNLNSEIEYKESENKDIKEKLKKKEDKLNKKIKEKDSKIQSLESEVKNLSLKKKKQEEEKQVATKASDSNSDKSVKSTHSVKASHYSAYCPTCGQWGGITATGDDISNSIYVKGKRVIAVDPNVIPLGSTVRVEGGGYNFEALALDTGGAIKGNRIDILVNSTEEAYSLGMKDVKVKVLN